MEHRSWSSAWLPDVRKRLRDLDDFVDDFPFIGERAIARYLGKLEPSSDHEEEFDWDLLNHRKNVTRFRQIVLQILRETETQIVSMSRNGIVALKRIMELSYDPIIAIQKGKRDFGTYWIYDWSHPKQFNQVMPFGFRPHDDDLLNIEAQPVTEYVFTCNASLRSIVWENVVLYNADFPSMKEIRLYDNEPLVLVEISKGIDKPLDISSLPKTGYHS